MVLHGHTPQLLKMTSMRRPKASKSLQLPGQSYCDLVIVMDNLDLRMTQRSSMWRLSVISASNVRYRRLEKLRSGRTFWRYVDSALWTRSSHGPRASEPSPNRRCYARCGAPSSG